jgi:prephenate dehydrogenase
MFNKIAIIGVGEIGGSIGLASRKRLAKKVVGICRRKVSALKAIKSGAVDSVTLNIKKGIEDADLIILATPVGKIVELGLKAGSYAERGALITDVGSTKKYIVENLEKELPGKVEFVGSHPMAGSEKGGPLNAEKGLFKKHDCFVTKTKNTDKRALKRIKKFWRSLGARAIEISPEEHDRIVARISQMVHIVASGLVTTCEDSLKYAASGFRDTTRIAKSDSSLWKDICVTNSDYIAKSLRELVRILNKFSKAISRKDAAMIEAMLEEAGKLRRRLG